MLYRITIDLAFIDADPVQDILDKTFDHWPHALPINSGQPFEEPAFIRIERCYHDESPVKPCVVTHYIRKPPLPPPPPP